MVPTFITLLFTKILGLIFAI